MKRIYKTNKTPLSNKEIDKFKDFDKVLDRLNSTGPGPETGQSFDIRSIMNGAKYYVVAAVIVGVSILAYWANKRSHSKESIVVEQKDTVETVKYVVNPLFPEFDIAYEQFEIDAQEDITLRTKRGSEISIKKNSFKDNNGNLITGKVKIKFREFHDPLSIFKSGIPMQYDSAGLVYTFESAGMFELLAEQSGVPLNGPFENHILVDLVSDNGEDRFNNYYFDTTVGQWEYVSKSKAIAIEKQELAATEDEFEIEEVLVESTIELVNVSPKLNKPTMPQLPSYPKLLSNRYAFKVEFDQAKFPELHPSVVFQVDEERSDFSAAYYDVLWDSVKLSISTYEGNYTVILKKGAKTIKVESFPVLSVNDYDKLKASYEASMVVYRKELKEHNEYMSRIQARRNELARSRITDQKIRNTLLDDKISKYYSAQRFRRGFVVRRPGFHNSDQPVIRYSGYAPNVKGQFKIGKKRIKPIRIYNVVGKVNMLVRDRNSSQIAYSKTKKNVMWVVYKDNKIAIADPEEFKNITQKTHQFTVKRYDTDEALARLEDMMGE